MQLRHEKTLASDPDLTATIELNIARGDQLLERPSSRKPSTSGNIQMPHNNAWFYAVPSSKKLVSINIIQICIAYFGSLIALEYGVDGFTKLRAAGFIDVARIDSGVPQAILKGLEALNKSFYTGLKGLKKCN